MSEQHLESVVHWFDTAGHRVGCGAAGYPRSTKHVRAVNCPSCVERLRDGSAAHADADAEATAESVH